MARVGFLTGENNHCESRSQNTAVLMDKLKMIHDCEGTPDLLAICGDGKSSEGSSPFE
jgi:hypothetical protein